MRFMKYQHIEKWGSPLVEGIASGVMDAFPKLDGACLSVYNNEDLPELGGRRHVLIKKEAPHIFKHFENHAGYGVFVKDFPDTYLYGEFGNKTTIGYYYDNVYGDFFGFDLVRYDANGNALYKPYDEYIHILGHYGIKYIPRIGQVEGDLESQMDSLIALATTHYVDPVKAKGKLAEGFILKNYNYTNMHGNSIWAKIVTSEYQARKHRMTAQGTIDQRTCEQILVDEHFTKAFFDKEIQKMFKCGLYPSDIPVMFKGLWEVWVSEEILNMLVTMKKFHKSEFHPGNLSNAMKLKVKTFVPDLFV